MAFLRQYIAPLFALVLFLIALFVVSARIFLPSDMMAPAPLETITPNTKAQLLMEETPQGVHSNFPVPSFLA